MTRKTAIGAMLMASCVAVGAAAAAAKNSKEATMVSASDLQWVEAPNTGGVKTARLWGDMAKGAHGVMVTFPAATAHPLHTHSAAVKMVVVSGAFRYGPEGGPEKSYGPGSYIMIPGNFRHSSGCEASAPCVLFHEATGKFDMKPAASHEGK